MSQNQDQVSDQTQDSSQNPEAKKEAYVTKKAYEEVSQDMHKFKQKAKELEATVNEFQAQMKAQEDAKMQEQEQWKQLFEKREAELEAMRKEASEKDRRFQSSVKISALKQEIGGTIRDEYLRFANLDAIALNDDGTIDKASLQEVANGFRKEHGQLIQPSDNADITGHAPSSFVGKEKGVNELSLQEKIQLLEQIEKQK